MQDLEEREKGCEMLTSVPGTVGAVTTPAAAAVSSGAAQDGSHPSSAMDWGKTPGALERDSHQVPNPLSRTGSWLNSVGLRSKSKTRGLLGEVTEVLVTGMRGQKRTMG